MSNVHCCAFLLDFTLKNQGIAETQWKIFCLSLYMKIWKFIFCQSESCVLTISSWSRRVKIRGLKSSIKVRLPIVSGNLKKILYSCLCTSFVSCYCVLTEKIDETGSVVTIDHFSRLQVGSLLVSFGDSNVWPDGLLQATVPKILSLWHIRCTIGCHIGYLQWFTHAYHILICDGYTNARVPTVFLSVTYSSKSEIDKTLRGVWPGPLCQVPQERTA